jgi:hypothetical protein
VLDVAPSTIYITIYYITFIKTLNLRTAMIGLERAPLSFATTAVTDADDQMDRRAFFLDEEALLRECVLQKGRANFGGAQILPMASFLDGDGQMPTSPFSLASTAIMDADDQMSPSPFSRDEALLRECVFQKGRTNFADGQMLPMASFLDGDGQIPTSPFSLASIEIMDADDRMSPNPFSRDEEALLRECLQAYPRHMPGAPMDEMVYDGSNVAFLQYPMLCTNFGIAVIDASAKCVPPIPQSAPQGKVEVDAELQRSDARAARSGRKSCLAVKSEVVLDRGGHTQKEKMSRETSKLLREWFTAALASNDHARGYPSTAIKQHLAGKSGASKTQIQNWLQNARRRLRKSQDRSLPLTRPLSASRQARSLLIPASDARIMCASRQ